MNRLGTAMLPALMLALALILSATPVSATPATENCDGDASITGTGSTLQTDAQSFWRDAFNNNGVEGVPYCSGIFPAGETISYVGTSSTSGQSSFASRKPAWGGLFSGAAWWSTDQAPNAAALHAIEEEGPNAPADNGDTVTIPVAGQAITLILNVPDACIGTMTGLDEHGRVEPTNTDIEAAYRGAITTWAALVDTNDMACAEAPIDPVARNDSSGTTHQFKGWLYTKFGGTVMTSPNRTWQDLQGTSTTWPAAVEKAPFSGGPQVATTVANTDGAIGYVSVSDARDGGFWMANGTDDKYWTEIQTPESTWVDPATNEESSTDGNANCGDANYAGAPAAGHSEDGWATVTGYNTDDDDVYSICTLTYMVAWIDGTTAADHSLEEACTTRHYIGYVLQEGQSGLTGLDYSPLSSSLLDVAEANQEEVAEGLTCPAPITDLSVTDESGGTPCSATSMAGTDVNGGCMLHLESEAGVTLKKHVFGIESTISTCDAEFHARVDNVGAIQTLEQVLSGGGCSRQACKDGGEGQSWQGLMKEGGGIEGNQFMTLTFCVEPTGGGTNETCEIDVPFNETSLNSHRYEFGHATEMAAHGTTGYRCELVGHWTMETGGTHDGQSEIEIEIAHT